MRKTMIAMGMALALAGGAQAAALPDGILGIRVGMREEAAHHRLERVGHRQADAEGAEDESAGREIWVLDDARIGTLALHVGADERVQWVQAFARPGAPPIRYREIGDPAQARKLGFTIYAWEAPAGAGGPARVIEARGPDSLAVASWSIRAVGRPAQLRRPGAPAAGARASGSPEPRSSPRP
jgi:hypothetical protein